MNIIKGFAKLSNMNVLACDIGAKISARIKTWLTKKKKTQRALHCSASISCTYLLLAVSETKMKRLNKEPQILADNNQLSPMKTPGSLRVISGSHWDSVSAATVVTFSQPRCCCHHRLNEVPLCLKHMWPSLCSPFKPYRTYLNRPGQTVNTGIPDMERLWHREELCRKAKRKKWLLCIHVRTLKGHSIPTPTSLWVHILLVLLWRK